MPATSQMLQKQLYIDNLLSRAWYSIRKEAVDQVLKITPLYNKMVEAGKIRARLPDGTHWEQTIRYNKQDQNIKWFGRGDVFGMGEKEELTRLTWQAKNLGTNVVRFWDDERKIRGEAKLMEYAEDLISSSKEALKDTLAEAMFSNPTSNVKQINSLTELIATAPTTGYFGGLDRASNPHLRNYTYNFTGKTVATDLLPVMNKVYNTISQFRTGKQKTPDIILTTQDIYEQYEDICEGLRRIDTNATGRASLGFGELMFKNVEMFWDPLCPAGTMYFLNTSTLEVPIDPAFFFEMTEWKYVAGNSLDRNAQILAVLQMTCNMPAKNAVIYNIPVSGY
jgi:hypothetical protein